MDAPGAVVHLQRQHTSLLRRLSQALTLGAFKSTACNIHDWLRPGEFSPQELMVSAAFATPVEELRTVQRPAQPLQLPASLYRTSAIQIKKCAVHCQFTAWLPVGRW